MAVVAPCQRNATCDRGRQTSVLAPQDWESVGCPRSGGTLHDHRCCDTRKPSSASGRLDGSAAWSSSRSSGRSAVPYSQRCVASIESTSPSPVIDPGAASSGRTLLARRASRSRSVARSAGPLARWVVSACSCIGMCVRPRPACGGRCGARVSSSPWAPSEAPVDLGEPVRLACRFESLGRC